LVLKVNHLLEIISIFLFEIHIVINHEPNQYGHFSGTCYQLYNSLAILWHHRQSRFILHMLPKAYAQNANIYIPGIQTCPGYSSRMFVEFERYNILAVWIHAIGCEHLDMSFNYIY
jgi:hypothetical protein